jgi:hypothetical protein
MWRIQQTLRALIAARRHRRRSERSLAPAAQATPGADWLPPVLGPQDWQIGLMVDRSAGWYFDRH